MLECLIKSVGVTNSDCDCIVNGLDDATKAALKESTSGIYLDGLADAPNWKSISNIDVCKNFAEMSLDARDEAIQEFQDDLTIAIFNVHKKAARNYIGSISKTAYKATLQNNRRFQGIRIVGNERTDAVIKISKIRIVGNGSGQMNLKVVRSLYGHNDFELLQTYAFEAIANNYADVPLGSSGLEIPLGKDLHAYEYFFYYDREELPTFFPKDTALGCGCNGSDKDLLETYADIRGVSFTNQETPNVFSGDEFSHGIVMNVEIICKATDLICRNYKQNDNISIASNYAIRFKANEMLIEKIFASNNVNFYTMMKSEYLWGKRNHFRKQYEERIQYIASEIDPSLSDCMSCKAKGVWKSKIYS